MNLEDTNYQSKDLIDFMSCRQEEMSQPQKYVF